MDFERTSIPGLIVFRPTPHPDERGFFSRTFDAEVARRAGLDPTAFVQDSLSRSHRGVIRGLHVRAGRGEGKLVRCSWGRILDVVVDLRTDSPAFRSWLTFELDGAEQTSIFIPPGCAHGFQALTEPADISYRIDQPHDPSYNLTIAYDDPQLAIPWPLEVTGMSRVDREAPPLADVADRLGEMRTVACSPRLST